MQLVLEITSIIELVVILYLLFWIYRYKRTLGSLDADHFIAVAAHELKAPMTGIKGYLSMIMHGDAGPVSDKAKEYITEAVSEQDRLIKLVENILNIARIQEGVSEFNIVKIELNPTVAMIVNQFKTRAAGKKLTLEFKPDNNVNDSINADLDGIQVVITNLVSNAIKYADHGGAVVKVTNPRRNIVRFEIEDTGPGLTKEEQKHIFQRFYRAESNIGKAMGSGLGLYISKLLIENFKGKIGVESVKGKGSTFWFELPALK